MALDVAQIAAWERHLASSQMRWSTDPEVLFGFPKGSVRARAAHPPDRSPRRPALIEESTATALRTGSYECEYRAIRPDGSVVWLTERGRVFSDADGDRMWAITRDVTTERQSHTSASGCSRASGPHATRPSSQSRLKDEFLATLSHELRTPMNAILGWLSILESGKPIREIHSALAVIARNAHMQAKLIDDLLDMNRLISGNVRLEIGRE
jgi:signal transduction histidine kinase